MTRAEAQKKLERAVIALREARDSSGLRILLYRGSSYTAAGFRHALSGLTSTHRDEPTFARHYQLLTDCLDAAVEFEKHGT